MTLLRQDVVNQLRADTSPALLPVLLKSFLDELPVRHQQLQQALAKGEAVAVREAAHAIKSCAGTYGAEQLRVSAMALENAAADRQSSQFAVLANDLAAVLEQTRTVYEQYLAACPAD